MPVGKTAAAGLNRDHMSWVQAVADRAACGLIAVEGSTLFSEEGAKGVRKHFKNILESLVPTGQDDQEEELEPASPSQGYSAPAGILDQWTSDR